MFGTGTEGIWWYPKNRWWRTLVSILAITAANLAGYSLFYNPYTDAVTAQTHTPCTSPAPEIEWQTYNPQDVRDCLESGRPALVFIDVDWDRTNQLVEKSLNHSSVRDVLCQYDVAMFKNFYDTEKGYITLADNTKERINGWYIHLYPASGDLKPVIFHIGIAQEIEASLERE